jgi:exopolysaccharide biosynthesis predicted pyruvyltransferase EpsI
LQSTLSRKIDTTIVPLIRGKTGHICIIDPPGYFNVGASAILLGELDFIARNFPGSRLSFYDVRSYSAGANRFIDEATVLLLQGGGNFGDLWPAHHHLRMKILRAFPHKKIVQMPQSIHFTSAELLAETAAVIQEHRDFTMLVRDSCSFDFARNHFSCDVVLLPDMAFAMRPTARRSSSVDCFCLLRTDKEAIVDKVAIPAVLQQQHRTVAVSDWVSDFPTFCMRLDRSLGWRTRDKPAELAFLRPVMMHVRRCYASQRLNYGIELLSRGRMVATDRLHAHILCCLLVLLCHFLIHRSPPLS